jgi:hypothetical protein
MQCIRFRPCRMVARGVFAAELHIRLQQTIARALRATVPYVPITALSAPPLQVPMQVPASPTPSTHMRRQIHLVGVTKLCVGLW